MTQAIPLQDAQVVRELRAYGIEADARLCGRIRDYLALLLRWNEKIALTTVGDPLDILRFHFGESLFAASVVPVEIGRLADVGSGAGFPGMPLAMLNPKLHVVLIESNAKKTAFLAEVARHLELSNVEILKARTEDIDRAGTPDLAFVTARAVGDHGGLLSWAKTHLGTGGKAVIWLGSSDAERTREAPGWTWRPPVRIPGSSNRVVLVGSPQG